MIGFDSEVLTKKRVHRQTGAVLDRIFASEKVWNHHPTLRHSSCRHDVRENT
jgi:hypothetical protein